MRLNSTVPIAMLVLPLLTQIIFNSSSGTQGEQYDSTCDSDVDFYVDSDVACAVDPVEQNVAPEQHDRVLIYRCSAVEGKRPGG